eukprot:gene17983-21457_t
MPACAPCKRSISDIHMRKALRQQATAPVTQWYSCNAPRQGLPRGWANRNAMPAVTLLLALLLAPPAQAQDSQDEGDLSYKAYVHSDKRIKCLYGYAADKTGDHAAAVAIFEDCIRRWNDVYSMIWLAQLYETGIGVPRDLVQATALMRRGAHTNDDAAYARLARYHYGVALAEGRGTPRDLPQARTWLRQAAQEGVREAAEYLDRLEGTAP